VLSLVDKILAAKKVRMVGLKNYSPQPGTSEWGKEIGELVYLLYGLGEEEIRIIEGNIK